MKKSIYLILLVCFVSTISSARQRYYSPSGMVKTIEEVVETKVPAADRASKGFDLSPVGFFVLNM